MTDHPKTCSHCGGTLTGDAAGGLCPRCLMAMNFDSRTMHPGEEPAGMAPLPPEEIADRFPGFEILECLGRGGMGVVYKARQKSLDRLVAIKILPPEGVGEEAFSERFAREAATLAKLSHPNIVTVHDFGETAGLFYIVMEYVDGVNLRDLLREGKLEAKQALAIVPPICEALQYAHDKGIVHRDIKPENLLLDRDGRVKIADFGIASLVGGSGESAGTPPYMAPEQSGGRTDHRADIYALGVVLYEMLTGERPEKDVVAPSRKVQVDVRIDEMVLRALEKEPERRYQTAGEFRTVVETISETPPPLANHAADAPIRAGESIYATAEFLATTWGTMKLHEGMSTLALYAARLVVGRGWQSTEIPFCAVRRLSVMSYPFWLSPMGRISILVEFEEAGKLRRIALTPTKGMFPFLGNAKPRVAEWFIAIREAVTAANGQPPAGSEVPELYHDFSSDGLMWAKLNMVCSPIIGIAALTLIFSNFSRNPGPVLLGMVFFIGGFHFFARLRRNEWRRNNPLPKTADELAGKTPPADARELSEVRSEIAAPAIAMAVVGGINVAGCVFGLFVALLMMLVPLGIGARLPRIILPPWLGSPSAEGMMGVGTVTVALMVLMAGWMLLWLGAWVFAFVSALRMRQMKNRGWAIATAVIFVTGGLIGFVFGNGPTPGLTATWSMIELGVGIWALVSLLHPETQRAFENRKPDAPSDEGAGPSARSQVAAPATGLIVASAFNLLLVAAALFLVVLYAGWDRTATSETLSLTPPGMSHTHTVSPPPPKPVSVWAVLFPFASAIFVFVPSLLTFISAWRMRRLRGYGMAIVGSVLGILTPPGLLIGVIFGIWSLVVLSRREVREAFGAGPTRPVGKSLLIAGAAVVGIALLGIFLRLGLPMMQKSVNGNFVVVTSEAASAVPGQITYRTISGPKGSECFLDFETGMIFSYNGGSDRPGADLLQARGIDFSVRFDPGEPSVTYWGCSLQVLGGVGPVIDGPAMRPDVVEPGWGKSLRQIYNQLPVPTAGSSASVKGAYPLDVLVRTRNGPVAMEIASYLGPEEGLPQLNLSYVLLPPQGGTTQQPLSFGPVVERVVRLGDSDGPTHWLDLDLGVLVERPSGWWAADPKERNTLSGLGFSKTDSGYDATAIGMVFVTSVSSNKWDLAKAGPIQEEVEQLVSEHLVKSRSTMSGTMVMAGNSEIPKTYVFKTPKSNLGILQITSLTENPRGVKIRYKLVQSAGDTAAPAGGFIRQSGIYQIDGGELALVPSSGGRVSFAITRTRGKGSETVSIPDFFKQDGWFVYVDSAARVWIFDGVRQLDVVAPDGRYSAGADGVRALCPAAVWDAVPESVRKSYRETQESKPAGNATKPIPPEALADPGPKAVDPESHADAASNDPVFTLRWVAKADDKDVVALPDATKGRATHADGRVEEETLRVSKTWLLEPSMLRDVGWNRWKGFDKSLFLILKNDADILALEKVTGKRIGDDIAVVWRGRVIGVLKAEKPLANGISIPMRTEDKEASELEKELRAAILAHDRILIEDLALHMIVAIREKDDAKLKSLATDRIKGWPEALPVFAVELREHMRHFTGDDKFDLRAGESLVEGDLGVVRCTGPAALEGKCLVMFFVRTKDGWRNQSFRNGMANVPLAGMLGEFRKQMKRLEPLGK